LSLTFIGKGEGHRKTCYKILEGQLSYSSTFCFTLALNGVGGQGQAPANLPLGRTFSTPCEGGWVGPSSGLDVCGKSRPRRNSIPGSSSPLQGAIL